MIESRESQMGWSYGRNEEKNTYLILVGKAKARRPLGRPRIGWKVKCKMVTFSLSMPRTYTGEWR
jgi:hypothetical protein